MHVYLNIYQVIIMSLNKAIGNYVLDSQLGSGMYGTVYKCISLLTGDVFACKIIKRKEMKLKTEQNLVNEISILQSVSSVHIVKLVEI